MQNKKSFRGLGASFINGEVFTLIHNTKITNDSFVVQRSKDGRKFQLYNASAKIVNITGPTDALKDQSSFHVSYHDGFFYVTYLLQMGKKKLLCIAQSKDMISWEKVGVVSHNAKNGKIVSEYTHKDHLIMYTGGQSLDLLASNSIDSWYVEKSNLLFQDKNTKATIMVADVKIVDEGIFVAYYKSLPAQEGKGVASYDLYAALFDKKNPGRMLWSSQNPVHHVEKSMSNLTHPFGLVMLEKSFVSYWQGIDGSIYLFHHDYQHAKKHYHEKVCENVQEEEKVQSILERMPENPIMSPQPHNTWESMATYNPTAILGDDGKIHVIYRADGDDMMSVWGYASTLDGVTIANRSQQCIYQRKERTSKMSFPPQQVVYTSGNNGGGGCEDPRAVLIDGRVYVTFTAFDGWGSVRVGLTSISFEDFKNQRWYKWRETALISPPGEMNKNWVIFPEKINGKYAILHSFSPDILVDYVDDLNALGGNNCIKSNNTRPAAPKRSWDSWFRGVGPAPLKTDKGWLVLYHAMDHGNPDRYRLGALLLDLDDPTQEICRTTSPILEPEEHYENSGHKWGVVYSCGAVIKDGILFVYYGGADKYVCVAKMPLDELLTNLMENKAIKMVVS